MNVALLVVTRSVVAHAVVLPGAALHVNAVPETQLEPFALDAAIAGTVPI